LYPYFVSQSSDFCRHNPLCCFSMSVYCCKRIFLYRLSPETFGYILVLIYLFIYLFTADLQSQIIKCVRRRDPWQFRTM